MNRPGKAFAILLGLIVCSCDAVPAETPVSDPRLDPLWQAARASDRGRYGFTPLPTAGTVGWEKAHGAAYDAMLHQGGETSRTIAFVRTADGYRWVGEQESFEGPAVFRTADGDQHEGITLTYETIAVSGAPLNQLSIVYRGEDRRLAGPANLTLEDVRPILAEWGYRSRPD